MKRLRDVDDGEEEIRYASMTLYPETIYPTFLPVEKQLFYRVFWILKDGIDFFLGMDMITEIIRKYFQLWTSDYLRAINISGCDALETIRCYSRENVTPTFFTQLIQEYKEFHWNEIEKSHQHLMENTSDYDKDFLVITLTNRVKRNGAFDFITYKKPLPFFVEKRGTFYFPPIEEYRVVDIRDFTPWDGTPLEDMTPVNEAHRMKNQIMIGVWEAKKEKKRRQSLWWKIDAFMELGSGGIISDFLGSK